MGLDAPNYIVYIPKDFNVYAPDNAKKFKEIFLSYYEEEDIAKRKHLMWTMEIFTNLQNNTSRLKLVDFEGREYAFYTIVDFCIYAFEPRFIGKTVSYLREIYNISSDKNLMKEMKSDFCLIEGSAAYEKFIKAEFVRIAK